MLKLNGGKIRVSEFPNKEIRVKDFDEKILKDENILELKFSSDQDLITLMFVKKCLDEHSVSSILFIWYMPYSRMDRKIEGDLFSLKYICDFLEWLNFSKIVVMEPHSANTVGTDLVTGKKVGMLKNAIDIYPVKDWMETIKKEIGFDAKKDCIVFPDKGAASRYADICEKNICIMGKTRNPITTNLEDMYLKEGKVLPNAKCILLDDICAKGSTALWAAEILKEEGASEVFLVVAHCEKTIFYGRVLKPNSP